MDRKTQGPSETGCLKAEWRSVPRRIGRTRSEWLLTRAWRRRGNVKNACGIQDGRMTRNEGARLEALGRGGAERAGRSQGGLRQFAVADGTED